MDRASPWIERQLRSRGIRDERVLEAMARVPRERFVPAALVARAYEDAALPLAQGQTISQPYVVALTCELLALHGEERVLEVGTGSGYAAAVLAELAAEVVSIERIPELAAQAAAALQDTGYGRVELRVGDGTLGVPDRSPFDGIAVAAAGRDVPKALWEQLRVGGRIVLPLGVGDEQWLVALERTASGQRLHATAPVRFVPLVGGG